MNIKKYIFATVIILSTLTTIAQKDESYYMSKTINFSYEDATEKVKAALKEQGFGTITEIEMHEKLAEKELIIKPYKILGVCNPGYAYETLKVEENIGLFLPCKVLIKQITDNTSEVVMVNPSVLMGMLGNEKLVHVADEVTRKFKAALESL